MSAGPAPSETLGKILHDPSKLLVVAGNPWCSLACSCCTPISAVPSHDFPPVCLSSFSSWLQLQGPISKKATFTGIGIGTSAYRIGGHHSTHDTHLARKGHPKANTAVSWPQEPPGFWLSPVMMALVKGRAVGSKSFG